MYQAAARSASPRRRNASQAITPQHESTRPASIDQYKPASSDRGVSIGQVEIKLGLLRHEDDAFTPRRTLVQIRRTAGPEPLEANTRRQRLGRLSITTPQMSFD